MYKFIKRLVSGLVSKKQLYSYEPYLRNIYSFLYLGNNHQCPICNTRLRCFITLPNNDLLCPRCGSLSRDRRLWQLIEPELKGGHPKVLDFSPSRCLARKLGKRTDIDYNSTDLSGNFIAKHSYDITKLDISSESVDLIICYHILEHIDDDLIAMEELYRVMKPNGKAFIQTPFKEGSIYENPAITNPADREVHFGQDDHVRIYSVAGLGQRLKSVGFNPGATSYDGDAYFGLSAGETVFAVTKPL